MSEDLAEKLFGRVVHRRTGTHVPDPKALRRPFSGPTYADYQSVAYKFCRGCGEMVEVDGPLAHHLARVAGTPFDGGVPSGIYFETSGCQWCSDGQTPGVEVKVLPPLLCQ